MMRLLAVTMDCPDPGALAEFYRRLVGGRIAYRSDDFAVMVAEDALRLDFQRVEHYLAPQWPDPAHPAQVHLDFEVEDLAEGQRHAVSVGAAFAANGHTGKFIVFIDPVGHPFCLSLPQPVS